MPAVAILSDIHANVVALEAVLADLDELGIEQVVCLGDVAATGPAPEQVVSLLRERNWRFVRGNCDEAMVRIAAGEAKPPEDEHDIIDHWCVSRLSEDEIAFLAGFEPVVEIDLDGVPVCCYHGSPRSNLDETLAATGDGDLSEWFNGYDAAIFAGGHTHIPMVRRYRESLVINPGSVGLPFIDMADGTSINPLWAENAIVSHHRGVLGVELRRSMVDLDDVLQMVNDSEMPHRSWWAGDWTPGPWETRGMHGNSRTTIRTGDSRSVRGE
jgi:predicted phosphodiesterase